RSIFGDAIAYDRITIKRRKFFPLQPRKVAMAPRGHLHFHPDGDLYCDDFSQAPMSYQGLFIHEMTHISQTQSRGDWYLLLCRQSFCRYEYAIKTGLKWERYCIEQQAEIIRHVFL